MLSAMVMKLLAKAAEDRYQMAGGLQRDLQRCLADWEGMHWIDPFPLGEYDIPSKLLIPEKLYGREREIDALIATFERVVTPKAALDWCLCLATLGSASRRSSTSCIRCSFPPRGLFASGKFDQYKRGIPYATFTHEPSKVWSRGF